MNDRDREIEAIVAQTVERTLVNMGLFASSNEELEALRKDMMFLRSWREAMEDARGKGFLFVVGLFASGIVTAVIIGARFMLLGHP
jgi:hypothetical protein